MGPPDLSNYEPNTNQLLVIKHDYSHISRFVDESAFSKDSSDFGS